MSDTELEELRGISLPATDMLSLSPLNQAVKEMFNDLKIDMITDLTDDEIKLITRIYIIAELKDIDIWRTGLRYYMRLLLSRKRKSRSELLQAIEGTQKKLGFFDNLFNRNREDRPR